MDRHSVISQARRTYSGFRLVAFNYKSLFIFMLVAVNGCSTVKFAYNQLDWTIPLYIDGYVELDEDQYSDLGDETNKLLAWHCQSQLPLYSRRFNAIANEIAKDQVTAIAVAENHKTLNDYFRDIVKQATPGIGRLVLTMSHSQKDEIIDSLNDKNNKIRKKYEDTPANLKRKDRVEKMTERFDTWLGSVESGQKVLIQQWVERTQRGQIHWLKNRLRWQREFTESLGQQKRTEREKKDFIQRLETLLIYPERLWSDDYRDHVKKFRSATETLIYKTSRTLTESQRAYLTHKLTEMGSDFKALSCVKPVTS